MSLNKTLLDKSALRVHDDVHKKTQTVILAEHFGYIFNLKASYDQFEFGKCQHFEALLTINIVITQVLRNALNITEAPINR